MTSTSETTALRERVADAARALAARDLFIGTAGNISVRDGDRVALTATGAVLGDLTPDQVTIVALDGTVLEGEWAPTSEADLHLGVLRAAPPAQVGALVHTHSRYATALSIVVDELPVVHYQQLVLGGALRVAAFETFGSPALARAVGGALEGRLAALMANHGAVALGADLDRAVENALLVEWLCELYWRARAIGEPRVLDDAAQRGVIEAATRRGYGATQRIAQ